MRVRHVIPFVFDQRPSMSRVARIDHVTEDQPVSDQAPTPWWRHLLRHPFVLVPCVFYFWTCAPTIGLGDTAMLIDCIQRLYLSTHANSHNLTVLIGWLFSFLPLDSIALKANLASVAVGSGAVIGFYFLIRAVFGSTAVAIVTASCLMVSHSMWWHSSLTEVYAVNAVFTVGAIAVLWRLQNHYTDRRLYLLFLVAALSLFNHVQMGTLSIAATIVLVARMWHHTRNDASRDAVRLLVRCTAVYLTGLLPFVATYVNDVLRDGWGGAADSMSGSHFKDKMFEGEVWDSFREVSFLVFQQFPSPFLIAMLAGVVLLARRWGAGPASWALASIFAVNTGFFMFFDTWDRFAFLLPSFVILAFAGGYSIDVVWKWLQSSRLAVPAGSTAAGLVLASLVVPAYVYSQMSEWARTPGFWAQRYSNTYTSTLR